MDFEGKVAVITGGGSGIGRSLALALSKSGTTIVIADKDDKRLSSVQEEISNTGHRVIAVHCDVSDYGDLEKLAGKTLETFGTVDILFNNAGISVYGSFENMRFADYERVLNVNLLGVIRGVMAFLPYMIKRGKGYIVNTSSQVGIDGGDFSGAEPYPLSKYAVLGFSERLYVYARPRGVMVSVLCPSLVNTRIFSDSPFVGNNKQVPGEKQPSGIAFPPGSMLDPDDVAQVVIDQMNNNKFFILTPGTEKFVASALKKGRDIQKLEQYFQDNFTEPLID